MMELMGNFPKSLLSEGKLSSEYFNRNGELKHIHNLNYWGLKDVLYEKYKFSETDAIEIASFLEPLLEVRLRLYPSPLVTDLTHLFANFLQSPTIDQPSQTSNCL
jgi:hypothetical protein